MKHPFLLLMLCLPFSAIAQSDYDKLWKKMNDMEIKLDQNEKARINELKKELSELQRNTNNTVPFLSGFGFTSENDVFFPVNNKDENYTGHFRFDFYLNGILDKGWAFPLIRNLVKTGNSNRSLYFEGLAFTPSREAFDKTSPVLTERPYGSYISGGIQRTAWWPKNVLTTELSFGQIGSPAVGKVQNFIHEYITVGSKPVLGWSNQIGNPGRFSFYYRAYGKVVIHKGWKFYNGTSKFKNSFANLIPRVNYELTTGLYMNYTRLGLSLSNILFEDMGIINIGNPAAAPKTDADRKKISFKEYIKDIRLKADLNLDYRIVASNSMLHGHPIEDNSIHKISNDAIKTFVFFPSLRFNLILPRINDNRTFVLTYGLNYRTREYDGGKPGHLWGTLGLKTAKNRF